MEDRTGATLLGKYELNGLLGRGGMGAVYRGTHLRTGRKVAVKILDERYLGNRSIVQRFGREARAASAIEHPGIVEVLDIDLLPDGAPFLVMELLDGETLASLITRKLRLAQDEALELFTQLLEALEAAHERGIVHRDLKPDNIFLLPPSHSGRPVVKILDFGISQKADEVRSHLTQTGAVLGTPHYMSPEQALGEVALDARADVYAAAVVLYECVVGDVPFDAANYNALLQSILRASPLRPTERGAQITPAFEEALLAGMRRDREARPASATAFRVLLLDASVGRAPSASPEGRASQSGGSADASTSWGGFDTLGRPGARPATPGAPRVAAPGPPPPGAAAPPLETLLTGVGCAAASARALGAHSSTTSRRPRAAPRSSSTDAPSPRSGEARRAGQPRARGDPAVTPLPGRGAEPAVTPAPTGERAATARLATPADGAGRSSRPAEPSAPSDAEGTADLLAPAPPPGRALSGDEAPLQLAASARAAQRHNASRSYHRLPSRGGGSFAPPAPVTRRRGGLLGWLDGLPTAVRLGGGAALALTLVVVAIRVAVHHSAAPAVEPPPTPRPTPAEPAAASAAVVDTSSVVVRVMGVPPRARIRLDGLPVGALPVRMRRGEPHVLVIEAAGYERREIPLTPEHDVTLSADLRPAR